MTDGGIPLGDVDRLTRLVSRVFQTSPNVAESNAVLGEMADLLGERRAIGFRIDPFSLRVTVGAVIGFEPATASDFLNRYATTDPWLKQLLHTKMIGELVVTRDLRALASRSDSLRHRDYLRELRVLQIHGCAGAIVRDEDGDLICLSVYSTNPEGLAKDKQSLLRLLVRQLGFSASLRSQRIAADTERRLLAAALDLCQMPVFVVDGRGAIVRRNAAGQALLHSGDILQAKSGRLTAASGPDGSRLASQIARVTTASPGALTGTWHASAPEGGGRIVAVISTIRLEDADGPGGPAYALVSITDLRQQGDSWIAAGLLSELFGLTEAEDRIARLIDLGHSAAAAADSTGLSLATVRTHLSRIFEKTDTASQTELARLLALLGPFNTAGARTRRPAKPAVRPAAKA